MKRIALVLLAVIMLAVTPAQASHTSIARVEVMSQNLYIGADLSRLLTGQATPADLLETVEQTNYPERAREIAQGIDDFNPDLIGLQEVTRLTQFTAIPGTLCEPDPTQPPVVVDYLDILMLRIAEENENYHVGPEVENANVTLPVTFDPVFGFPVTCAQVLDRDVIIYRDGVTVSDAQSGNFEDNFTVPPEVLGIEVVFTRGWVSVDAQVDGEDFRFVNTHLEVSAAEGGVCVGENGPFACQDSQAEELIGELADEPLPVVLVGDFNAVPGMPAYDMIDTNGYTDTWTIRYPYNDEPGFTCCQDEELANVESELDERIDHIFIDDEGFEPVFTLTTVVGDWEERKTETDPPLWYSDHGGPWARMYLRFQ